MLNSTIHAYLVGFPNVGKTTLFNALTGQNQRVGNVSGVTVQLKQGEFFTPHGRKVKLIDLPGCYDLKGESSDEQVTITAIKGAIEGLAMADVMILVVDASHLERQLPFVLQILERGHAAILALNMVDEAEKSGIRLDLVKLSEALQIPVIPMQANSKKGIVELKQALRIPLPKAAWQAGGAFPWLAHAKEDHAIQQQQRLAWVLERCEEVVRRPNAHQQTYSDRLDQFFLHPFWGWMSFLSLSFLLFWSIFSLSEIPMSWVEQAQASLQTFVLESMVAGDLRDLIVDGIISGVGGVIVFVPQIALLFLFIGLLESTGYMARAAFLMDAVMAKAGLSGKSFLPLFSSFACAIPGVMATRIVDSAKERMVTIFVAPWMSCSARLPVYFLLIPLLMDENEGGFNQALVLFGMYALGISAAFFVAKYLRKGLGDDVIEKHFILELPPYRTPQWSYIFRHVVDRVWSFIKNAGTIILALSILLWAASTYPKKEGIDGTDALNHSLIGRIGAWIEPVVQPLGWDGRMGTSVLTSFAAREVFNSSMAILYRVEEADNEQVTRDHLRDQMSKQVHSTTGKPLFNTASVLSLLVFYVYALQCIPTSITVAREMNSWRWCLIQFVFMSLFAYLAACITYQVLIRFI